MSSSPTLARPPASPPHTAAALIIVTLGDQGCRVITAGTVEQYTATPVTTVDTTGAGDTFCGVLAASLAAGRPFSGSITAAQRAVALTVTRPGAFLALPTAAELRSLLA